MARTRSTIAVAFAAALLAAPLASAMHEPATTTSRSDPAVTALMARGQALDRAYGLGAYADSPTQAIRALRARGLALNRAYHLGPYAQAAGDSSGWSGVEVGGAAAFGAVVLGLAAAVALRRRRVPLAA